MAATELKAVFGADLSPLRAGVERARGLLSGFARTAQGALSGLLSGVAVGAGIGLFNSLSGAISNVASSAIGMNAQLEQSRIAFTTMLGSAEKADRFLNEMARFAAKTPFRFPELLEAAQRLQAFGFQAGEVLPMMRAIGDAAAALGAGQMGIDRITRALGQMRQRGKAMAQDMLQLTEAGVPAWEILAEAMGKSIAEVQELSSKGMISAEYAIAHILEGLDKRFGGMMDKQATTFQGLMSTIADTSQMLAATAFKPLFDEMKRGAEVVASFLQSARAEEVAKRFASALQAVIGTIRNLRASLREGIGGQAFSAIGAVIARVRNALAGLSVPVADFVNMLRAQAAPTVQALGVIVAKVVNFIAPAVETAARAIRESLAGMIERVKGALEAVMLAIQAVAAALEGRPQEAMRLLERAAVSMANGVIAQFEGMVNASLTALQFFARIGLDIFTGFFNAVKGLVEKMVEVVVAPFRAMAQAMDRLGISAKLGLGNLTAFFDELPAKATAGINAALGKLDAFLDKEWRVQLPRLKSQWQEVGAAADQAGRGTVGLAQMMEAWGYKAGQTLQDAAASADEFWQEITPPDSYLTAMEDASSKARDLIESLFQPTQSTDFTNQLDALGAHVDTWDEQARRMADIANRGLESPWVKFFSIPPEVIRAGNDAVRVWAVNWQRAFYAGFMPQEINMQAVVDRYKEIVASKEAWENIYREAEKAIREAGLSFDKTAFSQALGSLGAPTAAPAAGETAVGAAGSALVGGLKASLQSAPVDQMLKDIWEARLKGEGRKNITAIGEAAGSLLADGIREGVKKYDFILELARAVSPHVAAYIERQRGRSEAQ